MGVRTPAHQRALEDEVGEVGLEDEDQCHVHVEGLHRHPAQRRQQREVQQHGHDLKQRNDSYIHKYKLDSVIYVKDCW